MKKKTRRIVRLTRGEKVLYTMGIFSFALYFFMTVFVSASTSNLKMEIEDITYKINSQEKKNQSLTMQVNELTSYENLSNVLKEMGLAYNNENIKVIK